MKMSMERWWSDADRGKPWYSAGVGGTVLVPLYYYYSVVCLTTGPKPPPKRFLHIVRSKASSFKWEYPLLSLRSSSSFLRLLVTSISPFIFPSITCFRRHFLRKMWPIQLAFRFRISRRRKTTTAIGISVSIYVRVVDALSPVLRLLYTHTSERAVCLNGGALWQAYPTP